MTCLGTVGALHIEGNTFPVDQYYLEDLVEAQIRAHLSKAAAQRQQPQQQQQPQKQVEPEGQEGEVDDLLLALDMDSLSESSSDSGPSIGSRYGSDSSNSSSSSSSGSSVSEGEPAASGSSGVGGLPFITPRLPDDAEVSRLTAAAAGLKYAPYEAMIGADKFQPGKDYDTLIGRARAAMLDYKAGRQRLQYNGIG
jgi:hypothetical protein